MVLLLYEVKGEVITCETGRNLKGEEGKYGKANFLGKGSRIDGVVEGAVFVII